MTADTAGGVWTYAVELARALPAHGVEVTLATGGAPLSDLQREKVARIPGLRLFESGCRVEWMDDPWDDVDRAGEWLRGLAARISPDVVHLNDYAHGSLDWGVPVVVVGHSDLCSRWRAVHGEDPPERYATYRRRVRSGLAAADRVVAPTAAMLEALARHHGPFADARVIPHGRDATAFRPLAKEPMIFAAGRLEDEAKNLALLEAAAPRLPWPVYVAGASRRPDEVDGGAGCRHTHPLGRLSARALAAWLGRAAIYALPARYEPFGLSALEAGLAGCALVLGDLPSLREVWGEAAVFVDPGDAATLEREIVRLAGDDARRGALAAAARRRAGELTAERMAEAYLALYGELTGSDDRGERLPADGGAAAAEWPRERRAAGGFAATWLR